MQSLIVTMFALLGLLLTGCGEEGEDRNARRDKAPPSQTLSEPPASADWLGPLSTTPPARWLASRDAGAVLGPEHPASAEFDRLLAEASKRFQEKPRMIANRAVQLQAMLASNGVSESPRSIIEGFSDAVPQGRLYGFGEMCQHYHNLRVAGLNREEALTALRRAHDGRYHGERRPQ